MSVNPEDELRALWQKQAAAPLVVTPEELRARARKFDARALRDLRVTQVSGALAVLIFTLAALFDGRGPLAKLGCALLILCVLWCVYGTSRFAAVLPVPADGGVLSCALHYRAQLVRQRNLVHSWPLGFALAAPGFLVYLLGLPLGPKHLPWEAVIAFMGVGAFVVVASLIYGRILAARLQQEIDGLDSMRVAEAPAPDGP